MATVAGPIIGRISPQASLIGEIGTLATVNGIVILCPMFYFLASIIVEKNGRNGFDWGGQGVCAFPRP
jgi:hypothetical protein